MQKKDKFTKTDTAELHKPLILQPIYCIFLKLCYNANITNILDIEIPEGWYERK